ncbi:hypothetical protein CEUSTIGMA_g10929.t1 [Chlamydomonas eustigma]|uniref:F-box domain-containing protein n=1 Tax=Chlamydomonas eustigma TaxID=1157962 RepID=A0A250XKA1_9CHLO|nr:hypothetical protein CEUSTIGMA_g10929.t1 [Chlamydomonas eustigma]|eukprot:GAX83504.1 hypothetical protein CEUSTIGMA_g10929.t1 [Chlamydomonas eustigma]
MTRVRWLLINIKSYLGRVAPARMKLVEEVHINRAWSELPTDVFSQLVAKLDNSSVSKLRLVCKVWCSTVDVVLEKLELLYFPDDVEWVDKFPVIKALEIVRPGRSGFSSPRLLSPTKDTANQHSNPKLNSSTDEQEPAITTNEGGSSWSHSSRRRGHAVINGLPDLSKIDGFTQLSKFCLSGEPVPPLPGEKLPLTCRSLTCNLSTHVSRLINLKDLEIRKVRLGILPSEISQLQQLTAMTFTNCNLKSIPAEVGELSGLRRLSCTGNQDLTLPASLAQLSSLKILNLSWTQSNLAEVFELSSESFKGLEELKLIGNLIRSLPPAIKSLVSLKVLVLSMNQIESLPPEVSALTSLSHLDVSLNNIQRIQHVPPHLVQFNLQGNVLQSLPEDMGHRLGDTLQCLDLSNNQLVLLPPSLGLCAKLQTLRLSFNQLQELPVRALVKLRSLTLLEAYFPGPPKSGTKPLLQRLQRQQPKLCVSS